jgi:hypothetical protein
LTVRKNTVNSLRLQVATYLIPLLQKQFIQPFPQLRPFGNTDFTLSDAPGSSLHNSQFISYPVANCLLGDFENLRSLFLCRAPEAPIVARDLMVLQVDQHLDFFASAVQLEVSLHNSHFPWLALFDFFRFWAGPLLLELVHAFTHRPHFRRVRNRRSSCRRCTLQSSTKLATAAVVVEVTAANRTAARLSFLFFIPLTHLRHSTDMSKFLRYCLPRSVSCPAFVWTKEPRWLPSPGLRHPESCLIIFGGAPGGVRLSYLRGL